jgi:predicted nucleotide-binding protein
MNNFYRRYKISQITNDGITSEEKQIIDFILDKIKDLTLFVDEDGFHNYMNSRGEFIFQHYKEQAIWVRREGFFKVLKDKYLLVDDNVIRIILKDIIYSFYKINVLKTNLFTYYNEELIEQLYRKEKSL